MYVVTEDSRPEVNPGPTEEGMDPLTIAMDPLTVRGLNSI